MPPANKKRSRPRRARSSAGPLLRQVLALALVVGLLYILIEVDPLGLFSTLGDRPRPSSTAHGATSMLADTPTPFQPASASPVLAGSALALPPPVWITTTLTPESLTATVTLSPQITFAVTSTLPLTVETPSATTTVAPWWEVYFTEPSPPAAGISESPIQDRLLSYIQASQHSIYIAAFEFNLTPVAEALIAAHQRGVDVRWITDDEYGLESDGDDGHGQFGLLTAAGIPVQTDNRRALMHNKFLVFDERIVWTGSTNLTVNDHFYNNNNVVVIHSPELAEIYKNQFMDMWAGSFGSRSPSDLASQAVVIHETPVQAFFSPEDNALSQLIPLIAGAQKSIRFMAFSYTHDGLTDAMLERAAAGVDVQGIFETRGSRTPYSAMPPLFCAGLPVRQDGNSRTFHHKVIVIDEALLITGSLNLSENANDPNNENTLVIVNSAIAAPYLEEFDRRWAEAKPPLPEHMACPQP